MTESQPDLRLEVEGEAFEIHADPNQPGAYHYSWVSGPDAGYGFTSRRSDFGTNSLAEHELNIRNFLALVDPETGYIEDDDE